MKNDTKLTVGVILTIVVVLGITGLVVTLSDTGQYNQTEASQNEQIVNESNVPEQVIDSKPGASALKQSMVDNGYSESKISIQPDGQLIVQYQSEAQNANQIKDEMSEIAQLYADVAVENQDVGSLNVASKGVILTVPVDSAIAHGDGRLDDEAYSETFYYDSQSKNGSN